MRFVRTALPALALLVATTTGLAAQNGTIRGQVKDSTTQQALQGVTVRIDALQREAQTGTDGSFSLDVPAGTHVVRATRIGYAPVQQSVTVTAGATSDVQLGLVPQASLLEAVVVTGYGTTRREAVTGAVSTVDAAAANVGVKTNVDQMMQGRAAGVEIIQNNGEPGAGSQILIRGGSSISNTNEPLYVIDGVPVINVPTEPPSYGIGGQAPPARNPLNMLNPQDIASITILKDASSTAIYGSRAANGVVLIETKKGTKGGGPTVEFSAYVAAASAAKSLDVLNGSEYRSFVTDQVALFNTDTAAGIPVDSARGLDPQHAANLGSANTAWEKEVTRSAVTQNYDVSFTGGGEDTRYRASLNYMNQPGVAIANGLERLQGALNATHNAFDNKLRFGVNITASRVNNKYITFEQTGGFEGGVFQNVAIFNPTKPVMVTDSTGTHYYEVVGSTSVRNPVALANQVSDEGSTSRVIGNATADYDLATGLTAHVTLGGDHSGGSRQLYYPNENPVGQALGGGLARQYDLDNTTGTIQTLLTYNKPFGDNNTLDVLGGYEYNKFTSNLFMAEGIGFITDAFSFNNLGAARTRNDSSFAQDWKLVSFLSRANVGIKDKYFLTGILRYDGSSKFAQGHKWAAFPGISGSWKLSSENFMSGSPFSDLRLRLGWGRQGNPGIAPYQSLVTYQGGSGANYPWGDAPANGVIPTGNGNPDLKWEQTDQYNVGIDFGLGGNRFAGSIDYYVKNTSDLLLNVQVPPPAFSSTSLQNVGKLKNSGFELSLDWLAVSKPSMTWRTGLVFATYRNKVEDLGPYTFLRSGSVSGQGQSDQWSQRIMPGQPLGTFFGPVFLGVDANGKQLFRCAGTSGGCTNGQTTTPQASDYAIIGNANPDFSFGLTNALNKGKWNLSFLIRGAMGLDVFNNTALVYSTKGNALQDKNFLRPALSDPTGLHEPAIFSSRWVESASFVRLQNITLEYNLDLPMLTRNARSARVYVSGDNLLTLTGYSGLDPEVYANAGLASRGVDYLSYPRPRLVTGGIRFVF
ncbi:MAG TPA: SusC/RagA family TonB-linked outer membrane protein [Gemmatimonadales bacterium]|nr:SusC/RagA family TonB-linked outer membrane protein [Gemmatimonadales bacterium]